MLEQVPFQIVTRAASRRASERANRAQATTAAPSPAPLVARATSRRRRTRSTRRPQAGSRSTQRRRLAPIGFRTPRRRRASPLRGAPSRRGANAVERAPVQSDNQQDQGPQILNNSFLAGDENANDYQDRDCPVEDFMQGQVEQDQPRRDQPVQDGEAPMLQFLEWDDEIHNPYEYSEVAVAEGPNTSLAPHNEASEVMEGKRNPVQSNNQAEQGPQILNNSFLAGDENANDYQDQDRPVEDSVQGQVEQNQLGRDQQVQGGEDSALPFLQGWNEYLYSPYEYSEAPVTDGSTTSLAPQNEAGEMMEWMELNSLIPGTDEENLVPERCTSPYCPVPTTISHSRGLYLHDGQPNQVAERFRFGQSNPPPAVWLMVHRLNSPTEQPGDRVAVDGFIRNHTFMNDFFFEDT